MWWGRDVGNSKVDRTKLGNYLYGKASSVNFYQLVIGEPNYIFEEENGYLSFMRNENRLTRFSAGIPFRKPAK